MRRCVQRRAALPGPGRRPACLGLCLRVDEAQMEQHRLRGANLLRYRPVAHGLACLTFQPVDLAGELTNHILEPHQVLLRGMQPQFGFVTAGMQARNTGRFFQHPPALLGLGLDDLADAPLVNHRRRARAGGGIGKQDLHVARAYFAAIDPVGRALLALDPARHVQGIVAVELGRCGAARVVDAQTHFGVIAGWTAVVASEDHVVHVGGAHGLVRGLAHHPAQRFHQIGLAAAVGTDDPGEPGLDQEVSRLDERLEADQAQPRQFHIWALSLGRVLPSTGRTRAGCGVPPARIACRPRPQRVEVCRIGRHNESSTESRQESAAAFHSTCGDGTSPRAPRRGRLGARWIGKNPYDALR